MKRQIKNNVSWIGYIDWELQTFHGDDYTIANGSSQNAYLIQEEKTVLIEDVYKRQAYIYVRLFPQPRYGRWLKGHPFSGSRSSL